MLKNAPRSFKHKLTDQIIPINGMLKNEFMEQYGESWDQIIPINGMLKNPAITVIVSC